MKLMVQESKAAHTAGNQTRTPIVERLDSSNVRKSREKPSPIMQRLVALLMSIVKVALVALIVFYGYKYCISIHTSFQADALFLKSKELQSAGDSLDSVAAEFGGNLANIIGYCHNYNAMGSSDEGRMVTYQIVGDLIRKLPDDTDLSSLLTLPSNALPARMAASEVIRSRKDLTWIILQAATQDGSARAFAVDILRDLIPIGDIKDINSLIAENPQGRIPRSADLIRAVQQRCEQKWVGNYSLNIVTKWRSEELIRDDSGYHLTAHSSSDALWTGMDAAKVSSQNGLWEIRFFSKQWTGTLDQLIRASLTCAFNETPPGLCALPHVMDDPKALLVMALSPNGFSVHAEGIIRFERSLLIIRNLDYYSSDDSPPAGFDTLPDKIDSSFSRQGGEDVSKRIITRTYFKPGRPGFESFNTELKRTVISENQLQ